VALNPRTFFWLLRRSVVAAFDDGCLGFAKGAAYSALLSFFPILASAAAILVQMRAEFVSRMIEEALSEIVPRTRWIWSWSSFASPVRALSHC
jgi:membrane protein